MSNEILEQVGKAAAAIEAVSEPTEPSGEMEGRLRRLQPTPSGKLVRMANGDVVYVPVVVYKFTLITGAEGVETKSHRLTKLENAELTKILDAEDDGTAEMSVAWLLKKIYATLCENYPDLKPEDMETWIGPVTSDINDSNPVVTAIIETLAGMRKN